MTRWLAAVLVCLLWAGIYLPGLGSTELKGEEGRRILPAVGMIDSGDWLVPRLGGEPYMNKPPLINWAIASAFLATDRRDEWAARLPSVLAILALGLLVVFSCSRWLGPGGALAAALFAVTSISLIEKGRLAEIEALYVVLTAMATIWWMVGFRLEKNPWAIWPVCGLLLGLGLLTKGPLHFLFFYGVVGAVSWRARSLRSLLNLAHLVGLVLAVGVFAAWLVPYLGVTESGAATSTWREQLVQRITENRFDFFGWLLAIPRGASNFLPWLLLVPLLWRKDLLRRLPPLDLAVLRGTRDATTVLFVALLLIPGMLARYTMPLLPPLGLLLALVLRDGIPPRWARGWRIALLVLATIIGLGAIAGPFIGGWAWVGVVASLGALLLAGLIWQWRNSAPTLPLLASGTAALFAAAILVYCAAAVPRMIAADDVRPVAPAIAAAVPPGEVLHVVDINYQPELFYYRRAIRYYGNWKSVPPDAHWFLVRQKGLRKARRARDDLDQAATFPSKLDDQLVLLRAGERFTH